jgi:hypothetical protein
MNFRSSKVDKRYLDDTEKQAFSTARQERHERRVKARRGALAYERNRDKFATEQRPGTGGISPGRAIQQQRTRQIGEERRRNEEFRPADVPSLSSPYPEDPMSS